MNESIMKKLIASINCGVCHELYNADNIKILGHEDDMWVISAICSKCKTKALVATIVEEEDIESIADLSEIEYLEVKDGEPVHIGDVLDMQEFLNNYSGNLSEMFS